MTGLAVSEDDATSQESIVDETAPAAADADQVEAVANELEETLEGWSRPTSSIAVDGFSWMPHLVRDGGVLHVHMAESMPRYIRKRLIAAAAKGMKVSVALPMESLYDPEVLRVLAATDANVVVLDEGEISEDHHLTQLADRGIPVDIAMRQELALASWSRRGQGNNVQKGRRLEGLLAFLLSQVDGFRVFERNLRAETDEIDIVVQVDSLTGYCWYESGVPFVIVEAKNWKDPVPSHVVSLLVRKLETRRGRARIGLLFAASTFTSDAKDEELKEAKGTLCVAMLDGDAIGAWISSNEPDKFLNDLIGKAMLR